jgi:hypothetical protein
MRIREMIMRRFVIVVASVAAVVAASSIAGGSVAAGAGLVPDPSRAAADSFDAAVNGSYTWRGRRYCWYDHGWKGSGWYWCGYARRPGFGWGGGPGWHSWRPPHKPPHHKPPHYKPPGHKPPFSGKPPHARPPGSTKPAAVPG